jgi:hypothetical protein
MLLGIRKIRSAGRTSGSIEITLPTQLHILEGIECRLTVQDGLQPSIMLQLDLSKARVFFREMWQKLRLGLSDVDDIGDFSPANFMLTLFPPPHWQERPPLVYADALAVLGQRAGQNDHDPQSLARLLAGLTTGAGYRLGLKGALALAFGDAVSYLITGTPVGLSSAFERGMACRVFGSSEHTPQLVGSCLDNQLWQQARPELRRVYDQYQTWQSNPETYITAQKKWYHALEVELGAPVFSVEQYVGDSREEIRP